MTGADATRVAVLGASGGVGRRIVDLLLDRGVEVTAQSRSAEKLAGIADRAAVHVFDPRDAAALSDFVTGADAVIFALGVDRGGKTTLFSDTTAALIPAMEAAGVRRLIAITGVGAGETRGHGGFLYDRIIYPLFTRHRYRDKERQEALIAASGLDWTIVRPAPFAGRPGSDPLQVITEIAPDTRLTAITRDEVARFVVEELESGRHIGRCPFIGHL